MGHNINKTNGIDSVFSVRQPMWHGLGQILTDYPTTKEALTAMNGDFKVIKVPVEHNGVEMPDFFKTVRTDTDTALGIVGARYTVIDNEDSFNIMDILCGQGVLRETGGVLGKGERVFITGRMPGECKVAGDVIGMYFAILAAHDGTASNRFMITPTRIVCQNTVNMAIKDAVRSFFLKHTKNYEARLQEAAKVLGITADYYTKFEEIAKQLVAMKYTEKNFFDLMDTLMVTPDEDASSRAHSIHERERDKLTAAYYADDLNNIRDTRWGAYNAIADYSDHARESRGDNAAANKFLRTFEATTMKDRAFELLTAK